MKTLHLINKNILIKSIWFKQLWRWGIPNGWGRALEESPALDGEDLAEIRHGEKLLWGEYAVHGRWVVLLVDERQLQLRPWKERWQSWFSGATHTLIMTFIRKCGRRYGMMDDRIYECEHVCVFRGKLTCELNNEEIWISNIQLWTIYSWNYV